MGEWGGKLQVQHREAKQERVMQITVDHPRAPLGDWETIISERRENNDSIMTQSTTAFACSAEVLVKKVNNDLYYERTRI